jgi:hypothetical protein
MTDKKKDFYNVETFGINWDMSERALREIETKNSIGIKKVAFFVKKYDHEKGTLLEKYVFNDRVEDIRLHVVGYNSHGSEVVIKMYGVKVFRDEKTVEDVPRENVLAGFYPKAEIVDVGMPVRWTMPPRGLVIHWTAGWSSGEKADYYAERTLKHGKKNGYTYASMSETGQIFMDVKATQHGYHSGSYHHRKGYLGLEMCNGGKLTNGKTWFNYQPPANRTRTVLDRDNMLAGTYMTFTPEQEAELIEFCLWLKATYPDSFSFDRVIGHDSAMTEIGKHGRKTDPGGSLSMTIPELQELLKKIHEERSQG